MIKTLKELLEAAKKKRSEVKELIESEAGGEEETIERAEALDKEAQNLERRAEIVKRCGSALEPAADDGADGETKTRGSKEPRQPGEGSDFQTGEDRSKKFRSLGDQMIAVRNMALTKTVDPIIEYQYRAILGGNVSVPSEGGFGVQSDFAEDLSKAIDSESVLAPRCRQMTIGANSDAVDLRLVDEVSRVDGSRWGGVSVGRIGEGQTIAATKPKIRKTRLELLKLAALYYATEEELRDGGTLTALAKIAIPEELAHTLDNEIWSGSGVGECLGVLGHASAVSQAAEGSQTADTVNLDNIVKMRSRMPGKYRKNAVWHVNQDVEPSLHTLQWDDGTQAWWPANSISGVPYDTLYGRPVLPIEQASTVGTVGDIAFIDWMQYLLIKKEGLRQDSSMHVEFKTDQMCFRFIERSNGMPLLYSAITPQNSALTQSPFVFLAQRD